MMRTYWDKPGRLARNEDFVALRKKWEQRAQRYDRAGRIAEYTITLTFMDELEEVLAVSSAPAVAGDQIADAIQDASNLRLPDPFGEEAEQPRRLAVVTGQARCLSTVDSQDGPPFRCALGVDHRGGHLAFNPRSTWFPFEEKP